MKSRRDFVKASLAVTAGMIVGSSRSALAKEQTFVKGIVYTSDNPGKWSKKIFSHLPVVKKDGRKVTLTTEHGMSEKHYIVRHTLVAMNGEVLGEKTFYPTDKKAVSVFEVPEGHTTLYATSFCNKHDFWVETFTM